MPILQTGFEYIITSLSDLRSRWRRLSSYYRYCESLTCDTRLSLLTMTNPNQLCDVLLFVCSKMADETNLSSKLPVADRTREV